MPVRRNDFYPALSLRVNGEAIPSFEIASSLLLLAMTQRGKRLSHTVTLSEAEGLVVEILRPPQADSE
jgi:hypothetical protein